MALVHHGIYTDKHILLLDGQFAQAARRALLDAHDYSWGHCGPVKCIGREVITQPTLGM